MKKFIIRGILLLGVSFSLLGVVVWNHLNLAYNSGTSGTGETGSTDVKSVSDTTMKNLIVMGSGYFLESHAGFQMLLNRVEMAELNGFNYQEMLTLVNETIANLENAKTYYGDIAALAAQTPYNPAVIEALKVFDYKGFQYQNNLNTVIFYRLVAYLISGNVTGIYKEVCYRANDILSLLYTVRKSLEQNNFPGIQVFWKINQLYSDTLLFGQYTAMVFMNLKY